MGDKLDLLGDKPALLLFAAETGTRLSDAAFDMEVSRLPVNDQLRIYKYRSWEDRQRALYSVQLMRHAVRKFVAGCRPFAILRDKRGRPFLQIPGEWEGDINLSHSGGWAVLAITNTGSVGIDVEAVEEMDISMAAQCLTPEEGRMLHTIKNEDKLKKFYEMWTMKEARVKTGCSPDLSLDNMVLTDTMNNDEWKDRQMYGKLFYLDERQPVSVCWNYHSFPRQLFVRRKDGWIQKHINLK